MKKVIIAPDSFKGSISSEEFCNIAREVINSYYPECETVNIPIADGGEGTVDAFVLAVGGEKREITVKGPFFNDIKACYAVLPDGTAVIEMAAAASLPMVYGKEDPMITTTYGVGELINDAVKGGAKNIIIGLGGSCTNDAAAGCLSAMGVKFKNKEGNVFVPTGGTLTDIADYDDSEYKAKYAEVKITAMCDITNPFYGEMGAAYIFAPQKGASAEKVVALDNGLRHFAKLVLEKTGKDLQALQGSGAAGGMGGGLYTFGAVLQKGIDCVLDTVHFEEMLQNADLIITGEGKIDSQSLGGKAVLGISKRGIAKGVPTVAVVGDIGDKMDPVYDMGIAAIYSINRVAVPFKDARRRSKSDLRLTLDTLMRTSVLFGSMK
ncbi:MAG: glycerate kinase [Clostridia bacterium]|nr:glycerate kinase [Clostridia bacterium]